MIIARGELKILRLKRRCAGNREPDVAIVTEGIVPSTTIGVVHAVATAAAITYLPIASGVVGNPAVAVIAGDERDMPS